MVIRSAMRIIKNLKGEKTEYRKTTVILKKLKKNRKYYVRVRAYRKVNGVKKYEHTVKVQAIAKTTTFMSWW